MTKSGKIISTLLVASLAGLAGCNKDNTGLQEMQTEHEEVVVVANKAGASISFIDAKNDELIKSLSIPGSEPMYVVFVPRYDKLYVGDRQQKKIHVINPATKLVEQSISVGNGVFHMWADAAGKALWVVNDADQTISVIDLASNTVVKTIQVGIKPHDVVLSDDGTKAYVSVFTTDASVADSVFLYNATDYSKIAAKGIGKEPHLFTYGNKLQVACQSGVLYTLTAALANVSTLALSGAHGIYKAPASGFIYVSDITGNRLYAVNEGNHTLSQTLTEMPATPHNIVVSDDGRKMYVSHSGNAATSVVAYNLDPVSGSMQKSKTISTAANPFGLTYYRR